jgi:hypothetical protein
VVKNVTTTLSQNNTKSNETLAVKKSEGEHKQRKQYEEDLNKARDDIKTA